MPENCSRKWICILWSEELSGTIQLVYKLAAVNKNFMRTSGYRLSFENMYSYNVRHWFYLHPDDGNQKCASQHSKLCWNMNHSTVNPQYVELRIWGKSWLIQPKNFIQYSHSTIFTGVRGNSPLWIAKACQYLVLFPASPYNSKITLWVGLRICMYRPTHHHQLIG